MEYYTNYGDNQFLLNSRQTPQHPLSTRGYRIPSGFPRLRDWKSFFYMTILYLIGLLAAVGQHFFYHFLDGRQIDQVNISQSWVSRISTAFSFLFKSMMVATVGIAYAHSFWHRVRGDAIRVKGINAMFSVLKNPLKFFNMDVLVRAKILLIIAVISWALPIAAIFAPGALTVDTPPSIAIRSVSAPVLGPLDTDVGFVEIGSAATFIGATQQLRRIAARVLTGGEIITWPTPCGSNCSYSLSFAGPAYQCINVTEGSQIPNVSYQSYTLQIPFILVAAGQVEDYNVWTGPLSTQGLWIRAAGVSSNRTFHCSVYEATYDVNVTYSNNLATIETNVTRQNQIPYSVIKNYDEISYPSDATAGSDPKSLWPPLNMLAIEDSVAGLIAGAVSISSTLGGFHFMNTLLGMSDLVEFEPFKLTIPDDLPARLEELLVNTTLSLAFFLQRPPVPQIVGENSTSPPIIHANVLATVTTYPAQYAYSARTLWLPYGIAAIATCLCIVIGFLMLTRNGVDSDMSFSQLLVTTRNSTLDSLAEGACLGGGSISTQLRKRKLRYGEIRPRAFNEYEADAKTHAGFGIVEEIGPLNRGTRYA